MKGGEDLTFARELREAPKAGEVWWIKYPDDLKLKKRKLSKITKSTVTVEEYECTAPFMQQKMGVRNVYRYAVYRISDLDFVEKVGS